MTYPLYYRFSEQREGARPYVLFPSLKKKNWLDFNFFESAPVCFDGVFLKQAVNLNKEVWRKDDDEEGRSHDTTKHTDTNGILRA